MKWQKALYFSISVNFPPVLLSYLHVIDCSSFLYEPGTVCVCVCVHRINSALVIYTVIVNGRFSIIILLHTNLNLTFGVKLSN